jgi:hypothetical protein
MALPMFLRDVTIKIINTSAAAYLIPRFRGVRRSTMLEINALSSKQCQAYPPPMVLIAITITPWSAAPRLRYGFMGCRSSTAVVDLALCKGRHHCNATLTLGFKSGLKLSTPFTFSRVASANSSRSP